MEDDEVEDFVHPLTNAYTAYGIGLGIERAAQRLESQAVDAFKSKDDKRAQLLREYSEMLRVMADAQMASWRTLKTDETWEKLGKALRDYQS